MARLSLSERIRLNRLAFDRARRSVSVRILHSPLLRWRYGPRAADRLLIVPQELRPADPSFANEMSDGHFGLGGALAVLKTGSPFDLPPPTPAWERELHGFGWLRHLRADGGQHARDIALALTADWLRRYPRRPGIAWQPNVVARRVISWIGNAALLLEDVPQTDYKRIANSLGEQFVYLAATWRDVPAGHPRLLCLIGLLFADLCIAGHDRHLEDIQGTVTQEIGRQILPDGGHVSRNPGILVELLLDLLPLRACFAARRQKMPAALEETIRRMMPMLRYLRLGDGSLARFNGVGAQPRAALATVLAYGDPVVPALAEAPQSRYVRLHRGDTVVIVDAGPPPPLELAGEAHAGCLSLEMSTGAQAIFVNAGAPAPADQDWRAVSRATASHNTLCLGNKSSSKLIRHPLLEKIVEAAPIRFPNAVEAQATQTTGGSGLEAFHDGYVRKFGVLHRRSLVLSADGRGFSGVDRIEPRRGKLRLARDIPFAIHFHLHPAIACAPGDRPATADLHLRKGERWRFTATGAELSIEESVHLADFSGPRRSMQIVLRGASFGQTEVHWKVEKVAAAPSESADANEDLPAETGAEEASGSAT
ncbi:MAG: heparinase II/III family protein [Hyphomicrobiaceae bacterium]